MDLYTGTLAPVEIAERTVAILQAEGRLAPDPFRAWVEASGGYGVIPFAEDGSRWVLRYGAEGGRYVHVHPARWAPATRRVRANVLKTAVQVLAYSLVHGGNPLNVALVNDVRGRYLDLAPIGTDLSGEQGLGGVIDVLRAR